MSIPNMERNIIEDVERKRLRMKDGGFPKAVAEWEPDGRRRKGKSRRKCIL